MVVESVHVLLCRTLANKASLTSLTSVSKPVTQGCQVLVAASLCGESAIAPIAFKFVLVFPMI